MKQLINFRQQYLTLENDRDEEDENNFEAGVESVNNMGQVLVSSFYISYYNTTVLLYKSLDSDNKFFNAIKYPNEKDPPKNGLPLTFGLNVDFEITNWITKDPKDRNLPYVVFKPITAMKKKEDLMKIKMPEVIHLSRFQLFFKFVNTNGSRLIRCTLLDNGLVEVAADSEDYDLLWTGKHVKRSMLQQMTKYQKINHFPRTFEITRKDRMYCNVVKFKEMFPKDGFDFLPKTYVLPEQYSRLRKRLSKESDDKWILKPNSSSRGRGIFIIKDINDVSFDSTERCVVSRYIPNPLLIDGLKFDLRIYIVMTSVYPLKLWMFNEGLTRFATEKYTQNAYKNPFIHLTNYSINKKSKKFVKNENNEEENVGNKWSFSAFLKFLHNSNVDTTKLVGDITDVITKAFISIEPIVFKYTKAFVQHRTNCYELFGVDVLIDDNLKPIIMEVNLSPSLSCDAPIDLRIKSKLVSDIFNIVGVAPYDRILEQKIEENVRIRTEETEDENFNEKAWKEKHRKMKANETLPSEKPVFSPPLNQATMNEVIQETQQELTRRGDFDLIFPNANNKYDKFFHPSKIPLYRYMRENMEYPKQSLAENVLKSKINVNNNAKLNIK